MDGNNLDIQFIEEYPPYKAEPGEEYMNPRQLEHFRNKLLAWKKLLMRSVDTTVDHLKNDSDIPADPSDRATQEEEFALELRTRDRERKLIKKIDESLKLIEIGDYGWCEVTGEPIGLERLEVRPTATLSIQAKELQERRERQGLVFNNPAPQYDEE